MVLILRLLDRTSNKYYSNTVSLKPISLVIPPVAEFLASIWDKNPTQRRA
jgi:hypothetical protein